MPHAHSAAHAPAWPLPIAEPRSVGLDTTGLARAAAVVQRAIDQDLVAGAITLVARRGAIAHLACQGMADRETGRAMTADAIFRIYSMTKIVTTVGLLMLFEEGRFLLGEPVARFIPAFAELKVQRSPDAAIEALQRPVTIHDLLTHCSGIDYEVWRATRGTTDLAGFVEVLCKHPLRSQPGERWLYGASTDVAGRLIEIISGQSLDTYFQQRIFAPLGMVDTGFHVPGNKAARLAQCYEHSGAANAETMVGLGWAKQDPRGLQVSQDPADHTYTAPPRRLSGGGGLVSTTADYLRFALMLLNGGTLGEARILGRKTVALMHDDHLPAGHPPLDVNRSAFGLGVSVLRRLGETHEIGSVGEYGWGGAACTQVFIDPAEDMITMIMPQLRPKAKTGLMLRYKHAVYAALL